MTGRRWLRGAALIGAAGLGVGVACIIPDQDIQVFLADANANPVRYVERIPLDEAARCACDASSCECPLPDPTGLPTYMNPEDPAYQFCICGENRLDEGRLYGTLLFAEDQDAEDGSPTDKLYAAALLDWDATSGDSPFDYVAYRNYLDPRAALDLYYSSYETEVIKRPRPYVRSISLAQAGRFDLCNDAGRPVGPGYHTFSVIVTDRPWYQRPGEETTDGIEGMDTTLDGVPDIAAGATYDVRTYVFFCHQEGDANCGCVEPTEE